MFLAFSRARHAQTGNINNYTYFEVPLHRGQVIIGVFISAEASIRISCRRGIPSVTFISPRPA